MTHSVVLGAFLAALFYVLIPGPAFLALLGIGADLGIRQRGVGGAEINADDVLGLRFLTQFRFPPGR